MISDRIARAWPVFSVPWLNTACWWGLGLSLLLGLAPIELTWLASLPITLQSLLIMLLPALWGTREGVTIVLAYLLLGGLGLPVFADGHSGWSHFAGPTGGFLLGFLPATWLAGVMVHSRWGQVWWRIPLGFLAAHELLLGIGLLWLGTEKGWRRAWELWGELTPGMLLKVLIATLVTLLLRWIWQRTS